MQQFTDDPQWMEAWRGILFTHARVIRAIERCLVDDYDLPLSWFDVLSRLSSAPDRRMRMQDLSETALFTRSGLTRLVDRLEEAGYVRREPSPEDRRGVYVVLEPEGLRRFEEAYHGHRPTIEQEFARHLDEADVEALRAALDRFWVSSDGA